MKLHSRPARRGFTLVEVIVVLVVLAILAAILIPAMTGWIDKAIDGNAITEARHCLVAAEEIAVERYAVGKTYSLSADKAKTMELAEAPAGADLQTMQFDMAANPQYMVYLASNQRTVIYQNGRYFISTGSGGIDLSNKAQLKQFYDVMQQTIPTNGRYYYSGTADGIAVADQLKAAGIDLDSAASTWSIRYNSANSYPKLYWTNADLSGHKAGDVIPVMAFTPTTEHYTVWNVRLVNSGGKLCLGSEAGLITTVDGDAQTYAQMLQDYAAVTGP